MKHEMRVEIVSRAAAEVPAEQTAPLYSSDVEAGFPSPAEDYEEQDLNLHDYAVRHNAETFFVRAHGSSMINAGVFDGDLLIVDRLEEVSNGRVVIAALDEKLSVKRFVQKDGRTWLAPENPDYPRIDITGDEAAQALGKSRSGFILENSLKASREVLLDRNHFTLKDQQWTAFVEALDAKPNAEQAKGLAKLFSGPFPW